MKFWRSLVLGLVLSVMAPLAAEAQQAGKIWRIGVLSPALGRNAVHDVFEQSLQGLGWIKNQNISIEVRYSAGRQDVVAPLAAELLGLGLDVLVAWGPDGALAAKRATSQVPVVVLSAGDPVQLGLVSTLAHPGGNITGISSFASPELHAKRLELLKEGAPFVSRVAVLVASDVRTTVESKRIMTAAGKALRLELREIEMKIPVELEATIRKAKDQGAQALYVWPSGFTFSFAKQFSDI